ncbi:DUF3311 domain-containing protein [Metabacillus fastidiosus]|uniref:DUF3311 domain-containing protein n=1 Tax=Metabacillus fastidiosus TaxID=1458 RepID=UPI003D2734CA
MKSKWIYILSIIPFIGSLGLLPFINGITIYVFGMPFIFFWVVMWTLAISGFLALIYKLDPQNKEEESE